MLEIIFSNYQEDEEIALQYFTFQYVSLTWTLKIEKYMFKTSILCTHIHTYWIMVNNGLSKHSSYFIEIYGILCSALGILNV